jgi:hypothetical protein
MINSYIEVIKGPYTGARGYITNSTTRGYAVQAKVWIGIKLVRVRLAGNEYKIFEPAKGVNV